MCNNPIESLVVSLLKIPNRLQSLITAYLLALMLDAPKRTLSHAAGLVGKHKSQFSRLLSEHGELALASLTMLALDAAKLAAKGRAPLANGVPWTIAIIIDATLHPRSSLHVHNAQRFNHGSGFVIGHQWTNIAIFVNGMLIPLAPIPFLSKNECKRCGLKYQTEHERLAIYFEELNLAQYIGTYDPKEVVVLADSGYDNKKLQRLILSFGWDFLSSLKTSRSAQTNHQTNANPKSWRRIDALFRAVKKQAPWKTVRINVDKGKKRRKFRARKLIGRIKDVHQDVALVCSEKSSGRGRRFFACSNTRVDVGAILRVYRLRWEIEIFHRTTKHQLGLLDAGVTDFDALTAHMHWVYCAYLMLHKVELPNVESLLEKQRSLTKMVAQAPVVTQIKKIAAARTQCGGLKRQKRLIEEAIRGAMAA
jgi:hypothetical protein